MHPLFLSLNLSSFLAYFLVSYYLTRLLQLSSFIAALFVCWSIYYLIDYFSPIPYVPDVFPSCWLPMSLLPVWLIRGKRGCVSANRISALYPLFFRFCLGLRIFIGYPKILDFRGGNTVEFGRTNEEMMAAVRGSFSISRF